VVNTLSIRATAAASAMVLAALVDSAGLEARASEAPAAGSIEMNRVDTVPWALQVLSRPEGLDFDHDGQREFVIRVNEPGGPLEIHECIGDNTFAFAHSLDVSDHFHDSCYPADAGDPDGDGLADLVVSMKDYIPDGRGLSNFGISVYESASAATYPTELTWEVHNLEGDWWSGGRITDGDLDGKEEIVAINPYGGLPPGRLFVVYENDADNSYPEVDSVKFEVGTGQSFGVLSDLDEDGRDEMLHGQFTRIFAFESTGDDTYENIWLWESNPVINVQFITDGGDLDGDGKKEFLAGGFVSNMNHCVLHVFESTGDNEVEIVASFTKPAGQAGYAAAAVADVDGNGRKEIVFGTTSLVSIYKNLGDDTWEQIWLNVQNVGPVESIGAGDHDRDGKDEIIFRQGGWDSGMTGIWEIDPAYQADADGDDTVDAIDNCSHEFNPGQEDADGDDLGDVCDNCVFGPNPDQGAAPLGQTIVATDRTTFAWPVAAEVVYAQGDLAVVSSYGADVVEALPLTTSLAAPAVPQSGTGLYYLVRPDCPVGSWQSTVGAEPGRDAALP
jgi:hypothetical protein